MNRLNPSLTEHLSQLDSELLEHNLQTVLSCYQKKPTPNLAQAVVDYLEALIIHPQLQDGDEQRCQYCRMARRWRYLAHGRNNNGRVQPESWTDFSA